MTATRIEFEELKMAEAKLTENARCRKENFLKFGDGSSSSSEFKEEKLKRKSPRVLQQQNDQRISSQGKNMPPHRKQTSRSDDHHYGYHDNRNSTSSDHGANYNDDDTMNATPIQTKTKRTIIRGCILSGRMPQGSIHEMESKKYLLKVLFFQADINRNNTTVDPLFHCRKTIHETDSCTLMNPVWNSSFLTHLPPKKKNKSDGFLQFVVYCMMRENRDMPIRAFIGQHTVKLEDSTSMGNRQRYKLYKWDGKTAVDADIDVLTEIFWSIHDR